jgi:hypothetical protein
VDRLGYYSKSLFARATKQTGKENPGKHPSDPITPPPTGLTYEQLTKGAWDAMLARDFVKALDLLQQATRKEPETGLAYSYLGIAYLYGYGDILTAEKAMREALAKEYSAMFRTLHDHSGTFQSYCYGWLYIGKTEIQFQSDEGHGFRMNPTKIKEAKLNSLVGSVHFAFHIKADRDNYNLAPGSLKLQETNLILALIQDSQWSEK